MHFAGYNNQNMTLIYNGYEDMRVYDVNEHLVN